MDTQEYYNRLGPLAALWTDPDVVGLMVDGCGRVYVERRSLGGKLADVPSPFQDDIQVLDLINLLVAPLGRSVDDANPLIDLRLPDGARLNAVVPPISLIGPALTMRKFESGALSLHDLLRLGVWDEAMVTFLQAGIRGRLNVLVSGGAGSGKTTLLNCLAGMIPADERIVAIETAGELELAQKYLVRLESRAPDRQGHGAVSSLDLIANALRMRPDRIIFAEVLTGYGYERTGEALATLFHAMTRGHDGSLIAMHAASPRDALSRLELLLTAADPTVPLLNVRHTIAAALQVIVHVERLRDGSRRVLKVSEVQGLQGDAIALQDVFEFRQTGLAEGQVRGHFSATGQLPRALPALREAGLEVPLELFRPRGPES